MAHLRECDTFNYLPAKDVEMLFLHYTILYDHSSKNNHIETKVRRKQIKLSWQLSLSGATMDPIFSFCHFAIVFPIFYNEKFSLMMNIKLTLKFLKKNNI
jgi:hypothetical protein